MRGMMRNEFASSISKEEISKLPLRGFTGSITVVDSEDKVEGAVNFLKKQDTLGFDTETRPSFRKGKVNKVALLQLSTSSNAFLFRLNKIGFNGHLTALLSDDGIIKVGTAIHDDIASLKKRNLFEPAGFIDLQQFVKQYNIESNGLKKLAAIVLNFRISKSQQTSNWENKQLTEAQQLYAATDAWVCLQIYKNLIV